jgi:hypothetical protein
MSETKTMKNVETELQELPDDYLEEVLDFVRFLKAKARQKNLEMAIASESSLGKDWLRKEEDEAWQDL